MSNNFGFEELIKSNRPFWSSDDDLDDLAASMIVTGERIPAGYTYLGQFIDHDITLAVSTAGNSIPPWIPVGLNQVRNARTPFLDLETLYGHVNPIGTMQGPSRIRLMKDGSNTLLRLGDTKADDAAKIPSFEGKDLPREEESPIAILVDQRNDENLAIAQMHVAFIRFHNAIVEELGDDDKPETFEKARRTAIRYYQWIILHDYLPKVLKPSVLADVLANGNQFYFPDPVYPAIPLEFSVAAFRMGHSMIRNSYNWNRFFNDDEFPKATPASLGLLMEFTGAGKLGGQTQLPSKWVINWNWFFPVTINAQNQKLNFASPIDTKLSNALGSRIYNRNGSLAAKDLFRGRSHLLPSGQDVAAVILGSRDRVLPPEQIANLLPPLLKSVFAERTPLWFYLLAEAEIEEQGFRMGEVGSRIIAETLVELIRLSSPSILRSSFRPERPFCNNVGEFGMPEMLKFGANGDEKELNPLGDCRCVKPKFKKKEKPNHENN